MYSTNSSTTTSDDLRGIASGADRIRRPVTANQPFSRLTDGVRHPVTVRTVGVEHLGSEAAHSCTKACYSLKA